MVVYGGQQVFKDIWYFNPSTLELHRITFHYFTFYL